MVFLGQTRGMTPGDWQAGTGTALRISPSDAAFGSEALASLSLFACAWRGEEQAASWFLRPYYGLHYSLPQSWFSEAWAATCSHCS